MEGLSFQYPLWYIGLCVLLGLSFALILYYNDKTFREQASWFKWLLGILRFVAVTFLSLLLLSPFLKSIITQSQKPIIILAQDNSESIKTEMSESELTTYQQNIEDFASSVENEFELHRYSFGASIEQDINFDFGDQVTNISDFLSQIYDLYNNRNLGAVVLATDGIYNQGSNPIYSSSKLNIPIYSIALGDTTAKKDIVLKQVFHNKIAYLDDRFVIQVDINGQNFAGTSTSLLVKKIEGDKETILQERPIQIDRNDFFLTEEMILDANEVGVQRYRVEIKPADGEISTRNNRKDIFIDVLDARQKVLILANSPHPDIAAIRQSLTANKNYEIEVNYGATFSGNPSQFDFVILHQLPSRDNNASAIIGQLKEKNIPRLFILGQQSGIEQLNKVQNLINIESAGQSTNEVQGKFSDAFVAFTLSEKIKNSIVNFAPLSAPFGDYSIASNAQVLFYQRIGKIDTKYPLFVVGEDENTRVGVLCAEGIWKWRLFDYLQNQNQTIFNEIIGKSVQYLGIKEDKRKFRVNLNKAIFDETESIIFNAELYNDNYELINEPDVRLTIKDSAGKEYNFTFDKSAKAYRLNAGVFPEGNYSYSANVVSNQKELEFSGEFSIEAIQLEIYETTADHRLLKLLSSKYGGELIYPDEINNLKNQFQDNDYLKTILYSTVQTQPIINLKWIFIVLMILICLEWFLRRYFGSY